MSTSTFRKSSLFRYITYNVLAAFAGLLPIQPSWAQVAVIMPPPGQMIHVTSHFEPPQMVGLKINLKDPFSFGFIMDQGQNPIANNAKKDEFNKIIKYFLVSLAMPNKDMWVNLSPFESNRVIPEVFGQTEMGRDLLAQDYMLKQFTGSLMYPEEGLGKEFWTKVYAQAQARFGTTDIDVNTFNKVWIVADHADVYQKGDTAFLVGSHLKVMLEQDFKAIENNKEQFGEVNAAEHAGDAKTQMASQLVREIIIPAIEKEVNEGANFAPVRQIYNAEIMATWFKKTLRESLLGQVFADRSKIAGQRVSDPKAGEKIFQQYLLAYKRGVFNYIKQDALPNGQTVARRYLSGGMEQVDQAMINTITPNQIQVPSQAEEEAQTKQLADRLSGQMQTQQFQDLVRDQLSTRFNGSREDVVKEIANMDQISSTDRDKIIKGLEAQSPNEQVTPDIMSKVVADNLNSNPNEAAQLVVGMENLPRVVEAQKVRQFASDEAQAAPQRLDLAQVSFAPAEQQAANIGPAVPTSGNLIGAMAERPQVNPQAIAAMIQYLAQPNIPTEQFESQIKDLAASIQQIKQDQQIQRAAAIEKLVSSRLSAPAPGTTVASPTIGGLIGAMAQRPEVSSQTIAAMVEHFRQPNATTSEMAPQIENLAAQIQQLKQSQQGGPAIQELVSNQLSSDQSNAPLTASVVSGLIGTMAQRPEVSPQTMAAMTEYFNQPDATAGETASQTEELATEFQQLISDLESQEAAAIQELVSNQLPPDQSNAPLTTPTASRLIGAMADRPDVTPVDIAAMIAHYNQPNASTSKIEPQIQELAMQIKQLREAPQGTAALQSLIDKNLSDQAMGTTQQSMPKVPGGINLSNEHLTLNVKVDGAGMPLPVQYQDKAMMNLNGLVSIIRSITPLTQQNVPALFELAK